MEQTFNQGADGSSVQRSIHGSKSLPNFSRQGNRNSPAALKKKQMQKRLNYMRRKGLRTPRQPWQSHLCSDVPAQFTPHRPRSNYISLDGLEATEGEAAAAAACAAPPATCSWGWPAAADSPPASRRRSPSREVPAAGSCSQGSGAPPCSPPWAPTGSHSAPDAPSRLHGPAILCPLGQARPELAI